MSEQQEPYITATLPIVALEDNSPPSTDEMKLLRRIRQARAQGRLLIVDCDAMIWYLVGKPENLRTH